MNKDIRESMKFYFSLFLLIGGLAVGIRTLSLMVDEKEKTTFNACRDAGGSVIQCYAGLK